jgi:hypothetical protein
MVVETSPAAFARELAKAIQDPGTSRRTLLIGTVAAIGATASAVGVLRYRNEAAPLRRAERGRLAETVAVEGGGARDERPLEGGDGADQLLERDGGASLPGVGRLEEPHVFGDGLELAPQRVRVLVHLVV